MRTGSLFTKGTSWRRRKQRDPRGTSLVDSPRCSTPLCFLQVSWWPQLFGSQFPVQGWRGLVMKWSWGSHEFLPRLESPGMSLGEATESPWGRTLEAGRVWDPERGERGSVHQECRPNAIRLSLALHGHQQFPSPRKWCHGLLTVRPEDGDYGMDG